MRFTQEESSHLPNLDEDSKDILNEMCTGAYTVISAIQGGPEDIVAGQLKLLRAAVANGVKRFIPSTFSYDIFKVGEGGNIASGMRRQFAEEAEQENSEVEIVHILTSIQCPSKSM